MNRQIGATWQGPSLAELETRIRHLESEVRRLSEAVEELRRDAPAALEPLA